VDWQGCVLLAAGLIPLLLAFTWAGDRYAWDSPALIGMFAGSVAVLTGFFLWERRAAQPILAPQLFRDRIFSSSIAVTFLVSMGMFGAVAFTPLFFQGVLGMTATHSGQFLTPLMLSLIVGSVLAGGSASRTGRYKVQAVLGAALLVAGAYLLTRTGVDTTRLQMTRNLVVFGLGLGLILPSLNLAGQNAFPHRLLGVVSSTQQFVTSLGAVIVAPILGTVLKNTFATELPKALSPDLAAALAAAPAGLREQLLSNPQALGASALEAVQRQFAAYGAQGEVLFRSFVQAVREALAHALVQCFVLALAVTVAAFAGVWFVKQIELKRDEFYTEGEGT
jgi:predicted MFS family arabinose efflux permease